MQRRLRRHDVLSLLRCRGRRQEGQDQVHGVVAEDAGRRDRPAWRSNGRTGERWEQREHRHRDPDAVHVNPVEENVEVVWQIGRRRHPARRQESLVPPHSFDPIFARSRITVPGTMVVDAFVDLWIEGKA